MPEDARPAPPTHGEGHDTPEPAEGSGVRPIGTLGVIALLTLTLSTLWLLALGVLEGRS